MNHERELLKGSTDLLLLRLISFQSMYGYQIIKELGRRSNGYFRFKEGTLYPALHRLERNGLIEGKWIKLPGGLERRYYFITQKGNKVMAERLSVWQNFSTAVDLIMQPSSG
ncbi:MAG: PadR family transcriptional regulator [Chloroflexi bacterium]|nr:PadR family transcriptional regulator [Chloroflexota bacterium]MBM3153744.1 PadR family transcriptional regulator [Chloroflexota bacterium]MBM3173088.1 PadR family transcriptional regulator [Chloroflexota bacterium]MBM3174138.1 PadR family transcriptional regulator [Chloroflexota bacterium]MBM4449206.1 PadR family transcriptional regulator [Chloroflexota bacterium]